MQAKNRLNDHLSCFVMIEPREGIHLSFEVGLMCNSLGPYIKVEVALMGGDIREVTPHMAAQPMSLYVLEEGQRGKMSKLGMGVVANCHPLSKC